MATNDGYWELMGKHEAALAELVAVRAEVGVLREALQAAKAEAAAFQKVYWEDGRRWEDERAGRIKAESANVGLREALTALLAATDSVWEWGAGDIDDPSFLTEEQIDAFGEARTAARAVIGDTTS